MSGLKELPLGNSIFPKAADHFLKALILLPIPKKRKGGVDHTSILRCGIYDT
jgi:hypothetical protein